ncbi:MAG: bifunctional histidinol-phosphatase/imidazoleglycerol-phosphate dehydratase HisB [Bdellovibrionales bacterium]|nr:bifunctional histidinol-phosphatase/imidazoleglycerol-phosphate dehydratase HisB [Bdellovibrionales bacterium]
MKRVLFLDRDGTIIVEPPSDFQVDSLEKLEFIPGAIGALRKLAASGAWELVLVTNQDGLGTASFPEETFWPAQEKMLRILSGEGVSFSAIHIDRTFPSENAETRKPGTGMLTDYFDTTYDLENSFVIGDRATDVELARNLGAKAIYFSQTAHPDAALSSDNWHSIADFLARLPREVVWRRATRETRIDVRLSLDGTGVAEIRTGLGFFDHMLEQVARHSGCDLAITVDGDLHIDEHHTIEDTAIALGEAFDKALGDKRGINRYGFLLPMDDALAQVALDLSGRSWLEWRADFKREKVGDMPTEMFKHFFKSFCDGARCNLNIQADGENEHHKIEAIFKGFAKALKMAVQRDVTSTQVPSTKGVL